MSPIGPINSPELKNWSDILKKVEDSKAEHQYITKSSDGRYYGVMTAQELKNAKNWQKLSISEIVSLSESIAEDEMSSKGITDLNSRSIKELSDNVSSVTKSTKNILNTRKTKRLQMNPFRKAILEVGYFWNLVTGFLGMGKTKFYEIYHEKNFIKQNDQLNEKMQKVAQDLGNFISHNHYEQKLQEDSVPEIVNEIKKDTDPTGVVSYIINTINEKINIRHMKFDCTDNFHRDMVGKVQFIIIDSKKGIYNSEPIPNQAKQENERVEEAIKVIKDLVSDEKDKKWIPVIQSFATQTSMNGLFTKIAPSFVYLKSKSWTEREENIDKKTNELKQEKVLYSLEIEHDLPPVKIEIVRDDKTNEIKELKIEVDVQNINIVKAKPDKPDEPKEKVMNNIFKVKLNYTVTLNPDNSVNLSDTKITYS